MKDDFLDKLRSVLSGSTKISNDLEIKIKDDNSNKDLDDTELVNSFMDKILDSAWVEDELKSTIAPSYHLSKKENSYWLLNVSLKILTCIKGGIEIVPIERGENNTLCMIGHSMYSIPNNIVICSGWN